MDKHVPPSTLVVCSSKEEFLKQLQISFVEHLPQQQDADTIRDETKLETLKRLWSTPTLRLLASSRTVNVVFCPDVTHLRAYLAAYTYRVSKDPEQGTQWSARFTTSRILAVLNPIALHRPTSSFSVQGINRTMAVAVEAAHHSKSRLIIAECTTDRTSLPSEDRPMLEQDEAPLEPLVENLWDEEVSILNVTTKSFGAGERGWVGRTVKVRAIAERWCVFQRINADGGEGD